MLCLTTLYDTFILFILFSTNEIVDLVQRRAKFQHILQVLMLLRLV